MNTLHPPSLLLVLVAAGAPLIMAACTESNAPPPPRTPMAAAILQPPPASACPLGVPGALVIYKETEEGAQLTFMAPPEKVADLRERAQHASAAHGPGQRLGKGHDGTHANGGDHGIKVMQLPPARLTEEDIDGGARISFTAVDKVDLEALRSKLRNRASEMMAGCTG